MKSCVKTIEEQIRVSAAHEVLLPFRQLFNMETLFEEENNSENVQNNASFLQKPKEYVRLENRRENFSIFLRLDENENEIEEIFRHICSIHKHFRDDTLLLPFIPFSEMYVKNFIESTNRACVYDKKLIFTNLLLYKMDKFRSFYFQEFFHKRLL